MKQSILLLIVLGMLVSCQNSNTSDKILTNSTESKLERKILIKELKRIETLIESKNKENIAGIFQFPLSDTVAGVYIDDSTFNDEYKQNGNRTTREMFIKYFSGVSESFQLEQVGLLFKKINVDSLLTKDTLEEQKIIKTEPCYHFYEVRIENDLVILTVGTNSNKDYKSKSVSEDEIAENDNSICEHVLWWIFRFDGKNLILKQISGAD